MSPGSRSRSGPGRREPACAFRRARSRLCPRVWPRSRCCPCTACAAPGSAGRYPGRVTTTPSIRTVGILSPGEMGSGVGEVLHQHGARVLTCLAGRGGASRERALRAGFEDTPDLEALVGACDVVLSIVPPAVAGAVADQIAAAVRATGADLVYADCNAIAPG